MPRAARRAVVHGRVQGVFYRDTVRRAAQQRGVAGWAANRSDGTVEVWLEGEHDAVDSMQRVLHDGPPRAEVERVDVDEVEPQGLSGFETR
jgi:acylphosphatase